MSWKTIEQRCWFTYEPISRTKRWKGSLRMSNSVDFWYLRISRRATVPGLNKHITIEQEEPQPVSVGLLYTTRCGRWLTCSLRLNFDRLNTIYPTLVANCLRGALPPVDLRAVCLVPAGLLRAWNFFKL